MIQIHKYIFVLISINFSKMMLNASTSTLTGAKLNIEIYDYNSWDKAEAE